MKDAVKFAPWAVMILVAGLYLGGLKNQSTAVINPNPTPVPTPTVPVTDSLESILTKEEAKFLSVYVAGVANYIKLDGDSASPLLKKNEDLERLVSISGIVVNLGREKPYVGLGKIVGTYFDEESEMPQLKGDLSKENRVKAVASWTKLSEDLNKVEQ